MDDITVVMKALEPGTEFIDGKLLINKELKEKDKDVPDDLRTMNIIEKVANSINENIQITFKNFNSFLKGTFSCLAVTKS